jgi:hypothetical protein
LARLLCKEASFDLIAGQNIFAGNVIVSNDNKNLYVTYQSEEGWKIKEIHLYAGTFENIPVNNHNVPVPGQFQIKESFDPVVGMVTYEIPLANLPECPHILAHAVVVREEQEETAWGKGTNSFEDAFDVSRWGWVINFCPEECDGKELVIALKAYVVIRRISSPMTNICGGLSLKVQVQLKTACRSVLILLSLIRWDHLYMILSNGEILMLNQEQ